MHPSDLAVVYIDVCVCVYIYTYIFIPYTIYTTQQRSPRRLVKWLHREKNQKKGGGNYLGVSRVRARRSGIGRGFLQGAYSFCFHFLQFFFIFSLTREMQLDLGVCIPLSREGLLFFFKVPVPVAFFFFATRMQQNPTPQKTRKSRRQRLQIEGPKQNLIT